MSYDNIKGLQVSEAVYPRVEPIKERLERRIREAKENLANLENALDLLNENPSLALFHDALTKVGF